VLAVTIAAAALAMFGGAAWAVWRNTGSGTASATAGSAVVLRLVGQPRPNVPLYPGKKSDLLITVQNDNAFPVLVTQVRAGSGAVTVDQPHRSAGCANTGVVMPVQSFGVIWRVPARSNSTFLLQDAVKMTNESHTACQGGTFGVPLVATGRSDAS
jgi:hypothetical protein